jgi:hypothetical protein
VQTLRSLYTKNGIERSVGITPSTQNVDNLIWGRWAFPSFMPLRASLCCAGPSQRLDSGKVRPSWAVVNWVAQDGSPGGGKVSGVSILQLKDGKIIRETMYY